MLIVKFCFNNKICHNTDFIFFMFLCIKHCKEQVVDQHNDCVYHNGRLFVPAVARFPVAVRVDGLAGDAGDDTGRGQRGQLHGVKRHRPRHGLGQHRLLLKCGSEHAIEGDRVPNRVRVWKCINICLIYSILIAYQYPCVLWLMVTRLAYGNYRLLSFLFANVLYCFC